MIRAPAYGSKLCYGGKIATGSAMRPCCHGHQARPEVRKHLLDLRMPCGNTPLRKYTWVSGAKSSRMLPPPGRTPSLSKALKYSRMRDLRCSSVIVILLSMNVPPSTAQAATGAAICADCSPKKCGAGTSQRAPEASVAIHRHTC